MSTLDKDSQQSAEQAEGEQESLPVTHFRRIRSFVKRPGRMTEGQKKAYADQWPALGLSVENGLLDYDEVFGRKAPTVLEIGFGMGASLVQMAKDAPELNFIGVEVHRPGVGKLLQLVNDEALSNLRVFEHDAVEVLAQCLPEASLHRVQVYFPDPWHKKKHNKRRLIQPKFVQQLRQKIEIGGVLHLATDWENYAEQMMEVLGEAEDFANVAGVGEYAPRPEYRPKTKFEARGERLGHGVWDLLFERRA